MASSWRRLGALCILLLAAHARADDEDSGWQLDQRTDVYLFGGGRNLHQQGLSSREATLDGLLVAGHLLRAARGSWEFEARPELRALGGSSAGLPAGDLARLGAEPPEGWLPLRATLTERERFEQYVSLERALVRAHFDAGDGEARVQAGRSVVSLGVLKAFPIWNRFSRPLPFSFGPQALIYGRDNVSLRYHRDQWAVQALGSPDRADPIGHSELTWFGDSAELHALFGSWFGKPVYGAGFATDIGGLTLRGEALAFARDAQAGLGFEYALSGDVTALVEGAYLSDGMTDSARYSLAPRSRFQVFNARAYVYAQLRLKLTEELALTPSTLVNAVDGSQFLGARMDYVLSENVELGASLSGPLGGEGSEFSNRSVTLPTGAYAGAPLQASTELRWYF